MKAPLILLLLCLSFSVNGQAPDSLSAVRHIDSLIKQLRPLIEQQKFDEATETLNTAQKKALDAFGEGHAAYALCLAYRGKIAQKQDKFKEAADSYLAAMTLQEKVYGREAPQTVISMSTLTTIYLAMGDYIKAEPLLLEVLAIREKLVGNEHPDYARTLGNLGSLNFHKGHFGQAELLYQEALSILSERISTRNPEYGNVLGNLAAVYIKTGNYAKAEPLLLQVMDIQAGAFGTKHPSYVKALANLASLYSSMGDLAKSEALNLKAKAVFSDGLEIESADYAVVVENLARLYMNQGNYDKAEPLLVEGTAVAEKIYGKQHINYALSLKNIAQLYMAKGQFAMAESALLEAHEINKTTLAAHHPNGASTAGLLAQLYQETKRYPEAAQCFIKCGDINRNVIERAAGYSSDVEMLAFIQTFEQYSAQFFSFAFFHPSSEIAEAAYNKALFYKGFLLNASKQIRSRAYSDPASMREFETLQIYQKQLSEQLALPVALQDSLRMTELSETANTLEKKMLRTLVGVEHALQQVDWRQVQAGLQAGEAAIEFIHFQYQNSQGKTNDSILYAALVLLPGNSAPTFIPLFAETALQQVLTGASGGNYRKINGLYASDEKGQNKLYQLIWQKLETILAGSKKVYCSPSGLLYQLNLAAIPYNQKQTIADLHPLVCIGSTRQLIFHEVAADKYNNKAFLVGGVRYAENDAAIANANSRLSRSDIPGNLDIPAFETDSLNRGASWSFLPGTVDEVLSLARIMKSARMKVQLDSGYWATEESLKEIGNQQKQGSPRVVHLATHGYFFPKPKNTRGPNEIAFKAAQNPLLRSGLILAGAQETWASGMAPEGRDDGVLTALEISLMDLTKTELVVLSACETGLGDIDGNEGVYGLQRAFKITGAKYIVMSLWKVNDQSTSEFMQEFYSQWLKKGLDIPDAFQVAQQQLRLKYPEAPYHWAGIVLVE